MAAREVSRLQNDSQVALTSDQKSKIKPILQELIDTANPSQDFLQQKADAINAAFTDAQKTFLNTRNQNNGNNPNGQNSNGNNSSSNSSNANSPNGSDSTGNAPNNHGSGYQNNNQNRQQLQPQDIYKQVLNLLT